MTYEQACRLKCGDKIRLIDLHNPHYDKILVSYLNKIMTVKSTSDAAARRGIRNIVLQETGTGYYHVRFALVENYIPPKLEDFV